MHENVLFPITLMAQAQEIFFTHGTHLWLPTPLVPVSKSRPSRVFFTFEISVIGQNR